MKNLCMEILKNYYQNLVIILKTKNLHEDKSLNQNDLFGEFRGE